VTATGLANIIKITASTAAGSRNEDPKFSTDGMQFIVERNLSSIMSIAVAPDAIGGVRRTTSRARTTRNLSSRR